MSKVDYYHISIITHCLRDGDPDLISATLPRFADRTFTHELYLQYRIGHLIRTKAPENEEAKKLLEKVENEEKKWEEFMVIAKDVATKVTDEGLAKLAPYLESDHKLKVSHTLKAFMGKNVFLHHIVINGIQEKLMKLDQNDKDVKLMHEKIRREIDNHRSIYEFLMDLNRIVAANGTTVREIFETKKWHLLNDNSPEGIAQRAAEEKELLELCGIGDKEEVEPVPRIPNHQVHRRRAEPPQVLPKTTSFALVRCKKSQMIAPPLADSSQPSTSSANTTATASSGYMTADSTSSQPSTSAAAAAAATSAAATTAAATATATTSLLDKCESYDVFDYDD